MLRILATLVLGASCLLGAELSELEFNKEEATSLLRSRRDLSQNKKIIKLKNKWNNFCQFNSMKRWESFKDELEETKLPEKEVDNLERCVTKCKRNDFFKDFVGKAYEETREKQEEKNTAFPTKSLKKSFLLHF